MTLATHAMVGAAFAELFPKQPVAAFALGFISHFVVDAIPHWDYKLKSVVKDYKDPLNTDVNLDKRFVKDCLKIGVDFLIGVALAIFIFVELFHSAPISIVLLGVIGAVLPDPLQALYWKTRTPILRPLQKFHIWIQKGKSLKVKPWMGILLQIILVIIVSAAVLLLQHSLY